MAYAIANTLIVAETITVAYAFIFQFDTIGPAISILLDLRVLGRFYPGHVVNRSISSFSVYDSILFTSSISTHASFSEVYKQQGYYTLFSKRKKLNQSTSPSVKIKLSLFFILCYINIKFYFLYSLSIPFLLGI